MTDFVLQGHIYYYILGGSSLTNYIFKYTNYVFLYIKSDQIFGIIKVSLMILKVFYANNSIYLIKKNEYCETLLLFKVTILFGYIL